jgi:hypothetical protein
MNQDCVLKKDSVAPIEVSVVVNEHDLLAFLEVLPKHLTINIYRSELALWVVTYKG